jgi:hypothetical protein
MSDSIPLKYHRTILHLFYNGMRLALWCGQYTVAYNKKEKFTSKQGGTNDEENNIVCISGSVSAFLFHGGIC